MASTPPTPTTAAAPDPPPPASTIPDSSHNNTEAVAAWAHFESRVQALIPAVVGLAAMFTSRHLPCPLRALSGSLGQLPAVAGGGFDAVTLR